MASSSNSAFSAFLAANSSASSSDIVDDALRAVREHLGMDVAFASQIKDGRRYFRNIDSAEPVPIQVGDSDLLDQGYCQRIVDGILPELIPDTSLLPEAVALPVTAAFPIGAHLSVPIRLRDGSVYGTFCCFSYAADRSLGDRDLQIVRAFADLAAHQIDREVEAERLNDERARRVSTVLEGDQISIVYQPIVKLSTNDVVGYECLARFSALPQRSPDVWFTEAAEVGLGVELELKAARMAVDQFAQRQNRDLYLSINASPSTILSNGLLPAIAGIERHRVVLEVTEHAAVADYDALKAAFAPLRQAGLRLAIDDTGAGFASMRHIVTLEPDIIKLDISLTRGIDASPPRRALAGALVAFADKIGAGIVAEGVETTSELAVIRELGVAFGQGYLLGRPAHLA